MADPIHEVLRDILRRHGTALIDDRRRCENVLREAPLARPEVNGLVAALDERIPRRLARQPAGTLAAGGIAALAAELSRNSGLAEPVARRSVEAWAWALGAASPAAEASDHTAPDASADRPREAAPLPAEDSSPQREAGRPAGGTGTKPWRAAALVAAGAAAGLVAGAAYFIVLGAIDAPSMSRVWRDLPAFCIGIGMPIGALAGLLATRRVAGRAGLAAGGLTAAALVLLGLWLGKDMIALIVNAPESAILVLPLVGLAAGVLRWLSRRRRPRPAETPPAPR
jgi:hypothetical protein